jgi:DNA helicase-2/ATP-dependent DNA helicase PcrA
MAELEREADDSADSAAAGPHQELMDSWASEADLLLAERARRRAGGHAQVALPSQLAVSALVTMARDPAELARQVRRPMPRPPAPHALRGTEFHRWLEERFGQPQLIDADELPGANDDLDGTEPDAELAGLKTAFETSEWADRQPAGVEVPFETLIGDRLIRGRIDAVFADAPDGTFDVVDWKTGRPPSSAAERRAVAVQLAAYRLAWADLARVPVSDVRAAFYYVRRAVTVRPADLMDEAGLAALISDIPAAEPSPGG